MSKTLTAAVCVVAASPLMLGCDESSRAQTAQIATLAQVNGQLVKDITTLRMQICKQNCWTQYMDCSQAGIANTLVGQISAQRHRPAFKIDFPKCNPDGCPEEPRGSVSSKPAAPTCKDTRESCEAKCK